MSLGKGLFCGTVLFLFITFSFAQSPPVPSTQSAPKPLCVVVVGDSTVSTYTEKQVNKGWGQFLEEQFTPGTVKVFNLAVPGRSTKTFMQEGRWKKALEEKPDYVLIQFGHNDSHARTYPESTDAATDYKDYLRRYVEESLAIGATPILITPMVRRVFDAQGKITDAEPPPRGNLVPYVNAMKEVGVEKNVAVIDLYASSKALAEKLGPAGSAELASTKTDVTHFNAKSACAMVALIVKELPTSEARLKDLLKPQ